MWPRMHSWICNNWTAGLTADLTLIEHFSQWKASMHMLMSSVCQGMIFAYQVRSHTSTGKSPFCMIFGRCPHLPTKTTSSFYQADTEDYCTELTNKNMASGKNRTSARCKIIRRFSKAQVPGGRHSYGLMGRQKNYHYLTMGHTESLRCWWADCQTNTCECWPKLPAHLNWPIMNHGLGQEGIGSELKLFAILRTHDKWNRWCNNSSNYISAK